MSGKIKNTTDGWIGKGKETVGRITGDESLEAEGKVDQAAAKARQAADRLKAAVQDAKDSAEDFLE